MDLFSITFIFWMSNAKHHHRDTMEKKFQNIYIPSLYSPLRAICPKPRPEGMARPSFEEACLPPPP